MGRHRGRCVPVSGPFLTTTQAMIGPKDVTLRKLPGGERVEIQLDGYGLGHVQTRYAATIFPEVRAWLDEVWS
jgi:hypothetical protein